MLHPQVSLPAKASYAPSLRRTVVRSRTALAVQRVAASHPDSRRPSGLHTAKPPIRITWVQIAVWMSLSVHGCRQTLGVRYPDYQGIFEYTYHITKTASAHPTSAVPARQAATATGSKVGW
ncbi:hypothetical protein CBM2617_U10097 [Cupriavidus taiwanensis]|nr:hypothetical protein CBM2617_U10097 [Cupriavidus taiwanensis]